MRVTPTLLGPTLGARQVPWWLRYLPSRIQFLDDFEGVLKWATETGTVSRDSSLEVFEGNYCLKLLTAATAGSEAAARILLGSIQPSKVMLQLRWHYKAASSNTPRYFAIVAHFHIGGYQVSIGLRHLANLSTPQDKWQYLASGLTWTDLPGGGQFIEATYPVHQYLMLKADVNPAAPKYIMAELADRTISMTGLTPHVGTSGISPRVYIILSTVTDAAAATEAYVDAFCFSDQEP